MKKITVLIAFVFLNSLNVEAQKFEAKAIIGGSASQIDGDYEGGYNKPGLILGGQTAFLLGGTWRLHQEISYYQRGSRSSQEQFKQGLSTFVIHFNYIDVSLLVSNTLNDKYIFESGFTNGFLLNAKVNYDNSGFESFDNDMRSTEQAITLGFGYKATPEWTFVARYLYSLTSVNKRNSMYNNSIGITVRYTFQSKE